MFDNFNKRTKTLTLDIIMENHDISHFQKLNQFN